MSLPILPVLDRASPTFASDVSTFFGSSFPEWLDAANAIGTAMSLNDVKDTSATSNTIGLGALTFTCSANKSFQAGMYVTIADAAAPSANSMTAQITSYSITTGEMVVNSLLIHGTGTKTSWVIAMAADPAGAAAPAVSGDISVSSITSSGKIVSTSPSAGIGYATGAGGAVTTSDGIATLHKICGAITLQAVSVAANGQTSFTITNNNILSVRDIVVPTMYGSQAFNFNITPYITNIGAFVITLTNLKSSTQSTSPIVVNFAIIRNVNA